MSTSTLAEWPALPYHEWESTLDTLHMWTQIVGKTRLALEPLINHWWNVTLYVTPVGLTTSAMHAGGLVIEIEFDLVAHQLTIRTCKRIAAEDRVVTIPLYARSVADFYAEYRSALTSLGLEVRIDPIPCEFDDPTPFDEDHHHSSYDKIYIESFRSILVQSDRVFKQFRTAYIGKNSPVHFFWGSFDLAVTRFSGRLGNPSPSANKIEREAYSHEVSSCGFWPGDRRFPQAAFYAYATPSPEGFSESKIQPAAAYWDPLGEFLLKYDDVRLSQTPESDILTFCQSTYDAAADLGKWDRGSLERR